MDYDCPGDETRVSPPAIRYRHWASAAVQYLEIEKAIVINNRYSAPLSLMKPQYQDTTQ